MNISKPKESEFNKFFFCVFFLILMLVSTISVAQTIDSSKKSKKKRLLSDLAIYAGFGTQQMFHVGGHIDVEYLFVDIDIGIGILSVYDRNPIANSISAGYIPDASKEESGLFFSVIASTRSISISTNGTDDIYVSLNLGWISKYDEGLYYKFTLGPGIEYLKNSGAYVNNGLFLNASGSIGYAF